MTGLDAAVDVILQAAVVITTASSRRSTRSPSTSPAREALARMSPFVRDMHTRTGLVDRVRRSTVAVAQAERLLLERISAWCPRRRRCAGLDLERSPVHRPLHAGPRSVLHYRVVDVSSVKVLAERWYGEAAVFAKPTGGGARRLGRREALHRRAATLRQTLFRP